MIKKIINKFKPNNTLKKSILDIDYDLGQIKNKSEILIISPQPIGNEYRGVYNCLFAYKKESIITIPQYYSESLYNESETKEICKLIIMHEFKKIILGAFPFHYKNYAIILDQFRKEKKLKFDILAIFHASFGTLIEINNRVLTFETLTMLARKNIIQKVGLTKKGMSESLSKILNINSQFLIPVTGTANIKAQKTEGTLNIGVFTHDGFRKNIHTQIAAALMFEKAKINVHKNYDFGYLMNNDRIITQPFSESYDDFLKILSKMDINFYVTYSENFGLVISESLSLGVPCLAADNSGILDYNEDLKEYLIVNEYDNSEAIYKQAIKVLENREKLSRMGIEYITQLNKLAHESFKRFIS